jgi:hypothetical protein
MANPKRISSPVSILMTHHGSMQASVVDFSLLMIALMFRHDHNQVIDLMSHEAAFNMSMAVLD